MRSINDRLRVGLDVVTPSTTPAPTLIGRAWLATGTSPDNYTAYSIPAGTEWVVARAVGAGGKPDSPYTTSVGGGGGAYAKAIFQVLPGDTLQYTVGLTNTTGNSGVQVVRSNSTIQCLLATGGTTSFGSGSGVYLVTSSNGTAGTGSQGGSAGTDVNDTHTLNLNGTGATANLPATGFGGGAFVNQTGVNTFTVKTGGAGLVVLEFWTGDPR